MTVHNGYSVAVPESSQFFTTCHLSCKARPRIPVGNVNDIQKTGESVSLHFTTLIVVIHLAYRCHMCGIYIGLWLSPSY